MAHYVHSCHTVRLDGKRGRFGLPGSLYSAAEGITKRSKRVSNELIEILILAAVAGLVLARLYSVLGKRTGSERPSTPRPQPAQGELRDLETKPQAPAPVEATGPAAYGLTEIQRADPDFDPGHFITGARSAYEMIVGAFGSGDRAVLQGLVTARVFSAYDKAIAEREQTGEPGPELVRLKSAEIADASLTDQIARVAVKFEAELAHGLHGLRDTMEKWTFERDIRSQDPNWLLARVSQA